LANPKETPLQEIRKTGESGLISTKQLASIWLQMTCPHFLYHILSLRFGTIDIPNLNDDYNDSLKGLELKSNEDALDSMLCLYIAGLHQIGVKSTVFGKVDTGYIWVPQQRCI